MMNSLGYNKFISMNSFRKSNFRLMADILYWLCKKLYPKNNLSTDINDEE